ncbi:MAG: DinB family protein [Tepidisphaeraceae bacterium]
MTDREMLIAMWDEMWGSYTWIPGWQKSFADLTAQQAAWKPATERKSIWQHLNHISFWRETTVNRLANKPPSDAEMTRCNFEAPADVSDDAWKTAQARLEKSHQLIRTALGDEKVPVDKIRYLLPHDSYHLGQVMLLRAMQGLPAVGYS